MLRRVELDHLLLRPRYIMRSEEPADLHRELHTGTRIRRQQFFRTATLGLAILHLLFELRVESLQIRFQKSNVATHHAEVRNLLSLYPKIHCLGAYTKEVRGVLDGQWRSTLC